MFYLPPYPDLLPYYDTSQDRLASYETPQAILSNNRTFHPFSRLPPELRDMIWDIAVAQTSNRILPMETITDGPENAYVSFCSHQSSLDNAQQLADSAANNEERKQGDKNLFEHYQGPGCKLACLNYLELACKASQARVLSRYSKLPASVIHFDAAAHLKFYFDFKTDSFLIFELLPPEESGPSSLFVPVLDDNPLHSTPNSAFTRFETFIVAEHEFLAHMETFTTDPANNLFLKLTRATSLRKIYVHIRFQLVSGEMHDNSIVNANGGKKRFCDARREIQTTWRKFLADHQQILGGLRKVELDLMWIVL